MSRFFEVSVRGCGIGGWLRTCCHFFVGEEVWVEVFGEVGGCHGGGKVGGGRTLASPQNPAVAATASGCSGSPGVGRFRLVG